MKKTILSTLFVVLTMAFAYGQDKPAQEKAASDTTKKAGAAPVVKTGPKPYKEVITDKAVTQKGMITTHKIEDKYFFEIADSLLGRDILVVARIAKAGAEVRAAGGYAGDEIGNTVIRFEKGPNDRIFLRKISYKTYSPDSTSSMYLSLKNSNIQPIAASFKIAAYAPDNKASVIDMTEYTNSDNDIFFFNPPVNKVKLCLGGQLADRSYIDQMRSFPANVEIRTVKTYTLTAGFSAIFFASVPGGAGSVISGSSTLELNTSLVLLPKVPMRPRYFDERIGYIPIGYTDFDQNPQGVKDMMLIKRWRLEPKPQDMARYKRGELVEPAKPIVFYLDPATPKKWVPYLMAGVNDWAKAFEKAGFKNAIIAKQAPTAAQDPNWSIDDARHSAIVYKPSEIPNAEGPSISDPRSGEIIESHINWYHNVQKLVHDWYLIQAAAIDPRARKMTFSDELMGDLIRFVSSHEVGHTLGLLHNFGSSSTVPVELLRNKKWVEANGHTPSIMDYARFNYVAQPEDHIGEKGIYPRIGDYDKWAIEWGYRYFPDSKNAMQEKEKLAQMTLDAAKNKRLWYGAQKVFGPSDPRSQSEALGDNAMKASEYGIKNLKVILKGLPEWTKEANEGYENLQNMYEQLVGQFKRYVGHVSKNIAGVYETPKTVEQAGAVYEPVPAAIQKEAIAFLNQQVFNTPIWLLDKAVLDKMDKSPVDIIDDVQNGTLNELVGPTENKLNRLLSNEAANGAAAYTVSNLFEDLNGGILGEIKNNQPIDMYRRRLQKNYINKLIALVKPGESNDISSIAKGQLRDIAQMIKNNTTTDQISKYHLQDLADRITNAVEVKKN